MSGNDLVNSFGDTLLNDDIKEVAIDVIDNSIDMDIDNPVFNEIPFVKTVVSFIKTGIAIKERNFLKQFLLFWIKLRDGDITDEEIAEHREELENNPKLLEKELYAIMSFLESNRQNLKTEILGHLYRSYLKHLISYDEFDEFVDVSERIFVNDVKLFLVIVSKGTIETTRKNEYICDRLVSVGLTSRSISALYPNGASYNIKVSPLGQRFYDYGLRFVGERS